MNIVKSIWWWKNSLYCCRCATAALAALLPTLLLKGRKILKDPAPDEHLPPKEQASTSEQRKEPYDDAKTDGLGEEDTFRVPGVVDGKS